jgi:tripartite-type tricarboxylate transporter receptor subunit TctC
MRNSRTITLGLICGAALAWPLSLAAQNYPTRPITMIVPFPPGGPTDTFGRIMAASMGQTLGQPVVNKWWPLIKAANIKAE